MAWLVWQASSGKAKFSFLQKKYCFLMFLRTKLTFDLCNVCLSTVFARNCSLGTRSLGLEKTSPGGRFSKDPVTYRARKSILETVIRLPWKAALLICFWYKKGKITAKFQSLKHVLNEDIKGFMSPEKFRDVRETGPRAELLEAALALIPA